MLKDKGASLRDRMGGGLVNMNTLVLRGPTAFRNSFARRRQVSVTLGALCLE